MRIEATHANENASLTSKLIVKAEHKWIEMEQRIKLALGIELLSILSRGKNITVK